MDKLDFYHEQVTKIIQQAKRDGLISSNTMSLLLTKINIETMELDIPSA